MNESDTQHSAHCPNCEATDSAVPVVAVGGTTLWRCNRDSCAGVTWTTETVPAGLRENPALEDVQERLLGAAEYRDEHDLAEVADDIAVLYEERTPSAGREVETPPTC